MARMDETNLRILQLLQNDARMSLVDIARAVGRAESTVRERIASLEMAGILLRYEARVDWAQAGLPSNAILRGRCDLNRVSELSKQLASIPNVTRALLMTGAKPILVILRVRDVQHLQKILREKLSQGLLTDVDAELALETLVAQRPPGPGAALETTKLEPNLLQR